MFSKMRIVGLISGGKDSIYNLMQCISAGHEIVALANIFPQPSSCKDELDSYMFQTVGHEGVSLIAEAIGLPLYRKSTSGISHCRLLNYEPEEHDEVEDLYLLIKELKEKIQFNGVAVGAIASNYQRLRVENVCSRLNLTSFAYLWQRDQSVLLREMIESKVEAILVKVASMGLDPDTHLGMTLSKLEAEITRLNEKYGVNVCGEGGEYESFVLDCPLFHKKIILEDTEIRKDSSCTSGQLFIKSARLESKFGAHEASDTWGDRLEEIRRLVPDPYQYALVKEVLHFPLSASLDPEIRTTTKNTWRRVFASGQEVSEVLTEAKEALWKDGIKPNEIAFVNLWINNMDDFAEVNASYIQTLKGITPARACVAVPLASNNNISVEMIGCKSDIAPKVLHIQSVSHWVPANIGPYSQCVKVGGITFVAGQIPLVPGSMRFSQDGLKDQVLLALRHVNRLLNDSGSDLTHAIQVTAFVSKSDNIVLVGEVLKTFLPGATVSACVSVDALPRFAEVELVVVAAEGTPVSYDSVKKYENGLEFTLERSVADQVEGFICRVRNPREHELDFQALEESLLTCKSSVAMRIFYDSRVKNVEKKILEIGKRNKLAAVPVARCGAGDEILMIIGLNEI